ncbi:hypothetical protein [Nostoc sp. CMAA1605]|uniref:hypothetical protein n=1 Tax=Nostoc sp. CMAA1605 TaxID=2055159 RepID=UPI001F2CABDE|nr:hypothetical protein [Nostoc sp. CMAA1605]MCF4969051.1 hypothetical protein [Nostoc sp. CMAA1605]
MELTIYTKLSDSVWQQWQTAKDTVNQNITSWHSSVQMWGKSLQETAQSKTNYTIDAVTQKIHQSWQTAEDFQAMTAKNMQTALLNPTEGITSAFNDWLLQHPTLWRLVQILDWATNHPILSLIGLLLILTLIWSMVKAMMRLIEKASWSLLQVPLKLIETALKFGFFSLVKIFNLAFNKASHHQNITDNIVLTSQDSPIIYEIKQQRLAEIVLRLEAIQQEQKELLQEASTLIAQDSMDFNIPDVIRNS